MRQLLVGIPLTRSMTINNKMITKLFVCTLLFLCSHNAFRYERTQFHDKYQLTWYGQNYQTCHRGPMRDTPILLSSLNQLRKNLKNGLLILYSRSIFSECRHTGFLKKTTTKVYTARGREHNEFSFFIRDH